MEEFLFINIIVSVLNVFIIFYAYSLNLTGSDTIKPGINVFKNLKLNIMKYNCFLILY